MKQQIATQLGVILLINFTKVPRNGSKEFPAVEPGQLQDSEVIHFKSGKSNYFLLVLPFHQPFKNHCSFKLYTKLLNVVPSVAVLGLSIGVKGLIT